MKRLGLLILLSGAFLCCLLPARAQEPKGNRDVAWFVYGKLGDAGCAKIRQVLDANHIGYTTTDFAATHLFVQPEQRELTKKLLKELAEKEKLPIHLSDEGEPKGARF